jgi:hypothetical protein
MRCANRLAAPAVAWAGGLIACFETIASPSINRILDEYQERWPGCLSYEPERSHILVLLGEASGALQATARAVFRTGASQTG